MIFNTWDYYLLFLIPSAILCRAASPRLRPWVIFMSGGLFFTYFSYTQFGGIAGAACLAIFLWETLVSRFYKPGFLDLLVRRHADGFVSGPFQVSQFSDRAFLA